MAQHTIKSHKKHKKTRARHSSDCELTQEDVDNMERLAEEARLFSGKMLAMLANKKSSGRTAPPLSPGGAAYLRPNRLQLLEN